MSRKLGVLFVLMAVFTLFAACSSSADIEYTALDMDRIDGKVKEFVNAQSDKNGIYLYETDDSVYLYLNGYTVKQGESAVEFKDIKVEAAEDSLVISFNEKAVDDYKDKELQNRLLYRITRNREFEYIKVYKNGVETHFDVIVL